MLAGILWIILTLTDCGLVVRISCVVAVGPPVPPGLERTLPHDTLLLDLIWELKGHDGLGAEELCPLGRGGHTLEPLGKTVGSHWETDTFSRVVVLKAVAAVVGEDLIIVLELVPAAILSFGVADYAFSGFVLLHRSLGQVGSSVFTGGWSLVIAVPCDVTTD